MEMRYDNYQLTETTVDTLKTALDNLPVYEEKSVFVCDKKQGDFKAIWSQATDSAIAIVSRQFALIQHKEAFSAVVDSLVGASTDGLKYSMQEVNGKAWLYVIFPELVADDGMEGIELGFRVRNSVKGDSALTFSSSRSFYKDTIEIFGRRLVCSNGMTIRIPLSEIQAGDTIDKEKVRKIFSRHLGGGYIVHKGDAQARLFDLKSLVQSIAASIPNINAMIEEAKAIGKERSLKDAQKFLEECGFGERLIDFVFEKYLQEQELKDYSNWELYNAITFFASHEQKSPQASENLLKQAQVLMVPKVKAREQI